MRAGQGESGGRVIKCRVRPGRGRMALCASGRESSRGVRRIVGRVEVVLMATDARRVSSGQAVVAIHVALHALQRGVRAG